jgi:hypothetical protein
MGLFNFYSIFQLDEMKCDKKCRLYGKRGILIGRNNFASYRYLGANPRAR